MGGCVVWYGVWLFWQRADHHDHLAAFHFGHVFDFAQFGNIRRDAFKQLAPKILVGHFAPAKAQGDFDLVSFFQELHDVAHFHVIVMGVGSRAELDLFDFDCGLLFAGFGFAFLLFIFELAEIHDLADRRGCVGGNLDQVEAGLLGQGQAALRCDDANIFAFGADQADFICADAFIDAGAGVARRGRVLWSAGDGRVPFGWLRKLLSG